MKHIFLIGAKSIGAYGGYETFINKLTEYHQTRDDIKYHIACKANGDGALPPEQLDGAERLSDTTFLYHNAECFQIQVPEKLGPAQAIYYDCAALKEAIKIIKRQNISHPIVYIMACRIGPFFGKYVKQIHQLGGVVHLNPDGHEWMRAKWSKPIRSYWKLSEKMMVNLSDLIICDSVTIEKYIQTTYNTTKTTYISYGAETRKSECPQEKYEAWLNEKGLTENNYYLVVGRFVPENNYETMICEFMKSQSKKDFAIITTANDAFLANLQEKLNFQSDPRIKFVGTVYDQELLMKIREEAFAYFHGHEVGGTNPSLLEALGCTRLNLLLDVGFNREVGQEATLYWTKEDGNLASLINQADQLNEDVILDLSSKAKDRIKTAYSWQFISDEYAKTWL